MTHETGIVTLVNDNERLDNRRLMTLALNFYWAFLLYGNYFFYFPANSSNAIYVKKAINTLPLCENTKTPNTERLDTNVRLYNARFVSREYLRQHENTNNDPSLNTTLESMSVYLRQL